MRSCNHGEKLREVLQSKALGINGFVRKTKLSKATVHKWLQCPHWESIHPKTAETMASTLGMAPGDFLAYIRGQAKAPTTVDLPAVIRWFDSLPAVDQETVLVVLKRARK